MRFGNGPRFDPLLEERGGWISGDVPKHDVVMIDAVIEVLAKVNSKGAGGKFNPFKEQSGEILPSNLERNFCGFLVRKDAISFEVDLKRLNKRIDVLKCEPKMMPTCVVNNCKTLQVMFL